MLNKLTLTCFRKHTDFSVDFTQGIQVIRAPSEGGKSTLLEAISYCLFGARSLRTPLEQAVTHGQDVKRLRVTLDLTVDGSTYTFSRGKSGAEVTHNGQVFVTGQSQVSSFAASLMGADSDTASRLMLAGQNSIRGALEDGPTALSQMIEDLAGFSTFDQILTAAQAQLTLGSPALLEDRLKGAEETLASAMAAIGTKPDVVAHEMAVSETQSQLSLSYGLQTQLEEGLEKATKDWTEASAAYLQRTLLEENVSRTERTLNASQAQVSELALAASRVVDTRPIEGLRQKIADSLDHNKVVAAHQQFFDLPQGPQWQGSQKSLMDALTDSGKRLSTMKSDYQKLQYEVRTLKSQRFDSDTCSKCGQKLPDATSIAEKNAAVDRAVDAAKARMLEMETSYDEAEKAHNHLQEVANFGSKFMLALTKIEPFVTLDTTTYPGIPVWKGEVPDGKPQDVASLRKAISEIEEADRALQRDKARYSLAVEQRDKALEDHSGAVQALNNFTGPDADMVMALTTLKDEKARMLDLEKDNMSRLRIRLDELQRTHQMAQTLWDMGQARIADAQKVIDGCKADLSSLAFNNNLVKKLRTIRPVVANRLWNTVLSSVSVMFSTMRKQESWITKEKNGFLVNGQSVEGLSGSTLDILGLAIRCAMLRTFLPQCGLLVLDEPMHGCDDNRAEAMLGFLKSAGFAQTLLVSHEEVSESVADNLILL